MEEKYSDSRRRNPGDRDQIEEYIKRKAEEEFKKLLEEKKAVDNFTVLLFGINRLFYRLEELQDTMEKGFTRVEEGMEKGFTRMEDGFKRMEKTIRNSMYPIWISIVAGIVTYIIINVFGI